MLYNNNNNNKANSRLKSILFTIAVLSVLAIYIYLTEIGTVQYNRISKILLFDRFKNSTLDNKNSLASRSFLRLHEEIVSNQSGRHNVVFYQATKDGYGNRIYSMLSAFMVAVLTDSALLIKWPSIGFHIDCLLKDTFKNFTDASFLDLSQKSPKICHLHTDTENSFNYVKKLYYLQDMSISPNCSRYYISFYTAYFFDLASDLKNAQKLVKYGFVSSNTVQKAADALENHKMSDHFKIEHLYMIGFEFAGHVLNNYWRLKPNLTRKVDDFVRRKFSSNFIIGIQLRNFYIDSNQDDIELFIDCAIRIEKDREEMIDGKGVKWFVASDDEKLLQSLAEKYQDKIVVGEGLIEHVSVDSNAYERALMDIELLSRCNETILTGGSTFGFIATLKSQKRPYVVEAMRNETMCRRFEFYAPARSSSGAAIF